MKVAEIMTEDPLVASPDLPLARAVAVMSEQHLRHLPVVEHGQLIGMLSERDLLEATGWEPDRYVDGGEGRLKIVRDYMTVPVESADTEDTLRAAVTRMLERRIGCLPVVAGERVVGVLSETDVMTAYLLACGKGIIPVDPPVSACLDGEPHTVESNSTVAEAIALCQTKGVRHLPVVHDGWFVGLVSDRDLRLYAGRGEEGRSIDRVMTKASVSVGPDTLVSDAVEVMVAHRFGSVTVVFEGRLQGLVTTSDVLQLSLQID